MKKLLLALLVTLGAAAQPSGGALTASSIRGGITLPVTCSVRQIFFDTDATAGDNLYVCTAANTWTKVDGVDSGGAGSGLVYCADAGASDTYTCTGSPTLAAYAAGLVIAFKPNTVNTGAATVNVDALGAKAVKLSDGTTDLPNGELEAGGFYLLTYDGTVFRLTPALSRNLYRSASAPATCVEGQSYLNTTTKHFNVCGPADTWTDYAPNSIVAVATASAAAANTTSETSLIGTIGVGTLTLAANTLTVGRTLAIHAAGVYSTQAVPATLNLKLKLGSTVIATSGAQTPNGAESNAGWRIFALATVRSVGASGTIIVQTFAEHNGAVWTAWEMLNTAAVTIDTTASQVIGLTATWGAAAAADTITGTNFNSWFIGEAGGIGVSAGHGISVTAVNVVNTDTAVVSEYMVGAGVPSVNCTQGMHTWTDSTNFKYYFCKATNTWTKLLETGGVDGGDVATGTVAEARIHSSLTRDAELQSGVPLYVLDAGANDTYTGGTTPALTAYTAGQCFILNPNTNNTGAATINIDAGGAKSILDYAGAALSDNVLVADSLYMICYDGTAFRLQKGATAAAASVPWVLGQSMSSDTAVTGGPNYYGLSGTTTETGTETARMTAIPLAVTATKLCVRTNQTQGSGGSAVFTLRVDAADQTGLQVTIAANDVAAMYCDTGSVSIAADSRLAISIVNNHSGATGQITSIFLSGVYQ